MPSLDLPQIHAKLTHLLVEKSAVNAEQFGGFALISFSLSESAHHERQF
jgi:hypothetical protein